MIRKKKSQNLIKKQTKIQSRQGGLAYDSKKAGHQKLGDGWGRLENELQKPLLQTPSPAVLRVGRGADLRNQRKWGWGAGGYGEEAGGTCK